MKQPRNLFYIVLLYPHPLCSDGRFPALLQAAYWPGRHQEVIIEHVSLAYAPSPYPYTASLDGGQEQGHTLFQPVWLFTGRTDTGQVVELVVRAVADND